MKVSTSLRPGTIVRTAWTSEVIETTAPAVSWAYRASSEFVYVEHIEIVYDLPKPGPPKPGPPKPGPPGPPGP